VQSAVPVQFALGPLEAACSPGLLGGS